MDLVGRHSEKKILTEALESSEAELIAVYGRRRVGKTFLVRNYYGSELIFETTGLNEASLSRQLENFTDALTSTFKPLVEPAVPSSWLKAFRMLITFLEAKKWPTKKVLFFDELPWFDSPRSGFLQAFGHFWNTWASKQNNVIVVICGSAASWMIQNIVRNKGGLHNRITRRIRLMPFTLNETEAYLKQKMSALNRYQTIELFMVTGGIPHYLNHIKPSDSATTAIDRLCFSKEGVLREEFNFLYASLFNSSDRHVSIVKALASKPSGLKRKEIIQKCKFSTGGGLTHILEELIQSGFIATYVPFGKKKADLIYKLSDEYSGFYLKFIENSKAKGAGTWKALSNSPSWRAWSGFSFENICLKHIQQIKKGLGISGIYSEESIWYKAGKGKDRGAQIDLLIDRNDNSINLFEIKFSEKEFEIDKAYAENIQAKKRVFLEDTNTKKAIFCTFLTTYGVKQNNYYIQSVQNKLDMHILFEA